jgi:group I intron endonuclease
MTGIYSIKSICGKVYIGSTNDFTRRRSDHLYYLKKGTHRNGRLQNYYNKYGVQSLSFEMIEECAISTLIEREQHYIDYLKPFFNIATTAGRIDVWRGRKHSDATKEKLRQAHLGHSRPMTEVGKLKISLANKGKKRSEEAKARYSEVFKGRIRMPFSKEHKEKISKALRGRTFSDAHRQNISIAMTGKRLTPEQCAATALKRKGWRHTPEAKEKIRQSNLLRWSKIKNA